MFDNIEMYEEEDWYAWYNGAATIGFFVMLPLSIVLFPIFSWWYCLLFTIEHDLVHIDDEVEWMTICSFSPFVTSVSLIVNEIIDSI